MISGNNCKKVTLYSNSFWGLRNSQQNAQWKQLQKCNIPSEQFLGTQKPTMVETGGHNQRDFFCMEMDKATATDWPFGLLSVHHFLRY